MADKRKERDPSLPSLSDAPTVSTQEDFRSSLAVVMAEFKSDIMSSVNESIAIFHQDMECSYADESEDVMNENMSIGGIIENFVGEEASDNDNLKSLVDEFSVSEKTSPAIKESLADIVNNLLKDKLPKEKLAPLEEKYLRPENCANLVAPKINKQVWQQLKQETKNSDSSLQKAQSLYIASLYATLKVCDNLSKNACNGENLTTITHAIVLSLAANRELNLKRRDFLRNDLNKQYSALCNPSTPITSFLFGDDLNKEVEDLTKANKLGKQVSQQTSRGRRPHPYNYRGRVFRGRGRGNAAAGRGRGQNSGNFLAQGRGLPYNQTSAQNRHQQQASNRQ